MDLSQVGCNPRDWIAIVEDRDQWRAYVRAVMNLRVPKNQLVSLDNEPIFKYICDQS